MAVADQQLEWQPEAPETPGMFEALVADLGDFSMFSLRAVGWSVRRLPSPGTFAPALYNVGVATAPVVALTGLTRPEDKERVERAGFAAFVAKPIHLPQLVAILHDLFPKGAQAD